MKSRSIRPFTVLMSIFLILITVFFAWIKTIETSNIKEGYFSTRNIITIQDILNSDLADEGKLLKLNNTIRDLPKDDEFTDEFKKILDSSQTTIIKLKKIKELLEDHKVKQKN
jgi:membrane-associated HD superfamily phosphohydrolase